MASDSVAVLGAGDSVAAVGVLAGVSAGGDGAGGIRSGRGRLTRTAGIGAARGGVTILPLLTSTRIDSLTCGRSIARMKTSAVGPNIGVALLELCFDTQIVDQARSPHKRRDCNQRAA